MNPQNKPKRNKLASDLVKAGITRPAGQPPKLPTVRDELLALIARGQKPELAAQDVGISTRTLYLWKSKGEDAAALQLEGYTLTKTEQMYLQFLQDFYRARNRFQRDAELELRKKLPDLSGKELLDALSRLDPERWGRRDRLHLSGQVNTDSTMIEIDRYGKTVAYAFRQTLHQLGLSQDEQNEALQMFAQHLESVTSRGLGEG